MDKNIRKLSASFSNRMMFNFITHGILVLAVPFMAFNQVAADEILAQAYAIFAVVCIAILWFCTWDFVRVNIKRGTEPFCSIWMRALPHDVPLSPEGDNAAKPPSRMVTVNALFLLRLRTLLLPAVLATGLAVYVSAVWPVIFLVVPLWLPIERRALCKILARQAEANPELQTLVAQEPVSWKNKAFYKGALLKTGYWTKDRLLWWLALPAWSIFFIVVPGLVPRPLDSDARAFFADVAPRMPPEGSGFFALAGLNAPPGTADIAVFGKQKAERAASGSRQDAVAEMATPALLKERDKFGYFTVCRWPKLKPGMPTEVIVPPPPPPPPPGYEGTPLPPSIVVPTRAALQGPCLYLDEWGPILAANKEMLQRYESLFRYQNVETPLLPGFPVNADVLMDLARLETIAHAHRAYTGDPENALKWWLADAAFRKRLVSGSGFIISFVLYKKCYRDIFRHLPYILSKQPALAEKYKKEIAAVQAFSPASFPYKKIWDTDFRYTWMMVEHPGWSQDDVAAPYMFVANPSILGNEMFRVHEAASPALVAEKFPERRATFKKVIEDSERAFAFRRVSDVFGMGQAWMADLFVAALFNALRSEFDRDGVIFNEQRMAYLWVEATAHGVAPAGMEAFLKTAAASNGVFGDIRSGIPFYWDPEEGLFMQPEPDIEKNGVFVTRPLLEHDPG
ncbi:MAG: hypothetical protein ACAH83_04920 [Alphaproteobacteria bacterium]